MRLRWKLAQAAEIRWWRRYWNRKDTDAYLVWKRAYWNDFLKKCQIDVPAEARCLDAGCGPAGIFTILTENEVTALDPLLDEYRRSLANFRMEDYPHVQFVTATLESWKPDSTYDFVFCLNAINHVSDWEAALETVWAAVRPGGMLVLSSDVNRYAWAGWLFKYTWGDVLHPQQHRLADYEQALKKLVHARVTQTIRIKRERWFDYYAWTIQKAE